MKEVSLQIHTAAPKLALNLWYLDDGILAGPSCDVRHALDVTAMSGPKWGLHINVAKCEIATHPASSHRCSLFPDIPGLNTNSAGNFHILGSPIGSTEFCREFFLKNTIDMAEESLEAIATLEDPQVALSLIRHCTGFCKMVYSLRTTPTTELQDICQRLDDAVQRTIEHFFRPLSDGARRQAQREKRYGGLGLRSAGEHSSAAYVASVAFSTDKDRWDPADAEGFDHAVREVNRRAGKTVVQQGGKIPKSMALATDSPYTDAQESGTELVIPRQRDLSHAIANQEFHEAFAKADLRTRARWISETGEGASEWAFVIPSKKTGLAFTPTEFRTLTRWWLGDPIYPASRPCPMEKCTLPLDPEGDHALGCKSGHGIIARHNALAAQFTSECKKAGFTPRREVSLGNKGPGGALTRPGDVFIPTIGLGQSLVLDFAVTHVQQPKYTDLVRDANWVTAGSFAERYATENKKKQREEAEFARHRFGAMVVESYGAWSRSAFAILKEVSVSRAAYSGGTLSRGERYLCQGSVYIHG